MKLLSRRVLERRKGEWYRVCCCWFSIQDNKRFLFGLVWFVGVAIFGWFVWFVDVEEVAFEGQQRDQSLFSGCHYDFLWEHHFIYILHACRTFRIATGHESRENMCFVRLERKRRTNESHFHSLFAMVFFLKDIAKLKFYQSISTVVVLPFACKFVRSFVCLFVCFGTEENLMHKERRSERCQRMNKDLRMCSVLLTYCRSPSSTQTTQVRRETFRLLLPVIGCGFSRCHYAAVGS